MDPFFGRIELDYKGADIVRVVGDRIEQISGKPPAPNAIESGRFFFASWAELIEHLPFGLLRENVVELCHAAGVLPDPQLVRIGNCRSFPPR